MYRLVTAADRQKAREYQKPKGAVVIRPKGTKEGTEIYVFEMAGKLYAKGFHGSAGKASFYTVYRTAEERERDVRAHIDGWQKTAKYKGEIAADRKGFRHTFKVGEILAGSFGYEQTNVIFAEVIATTAATVTVREIGHEVEGGMGPMSANVVARPGEFIGEARTLRVQGHGAKDDGHVRWNSSCSLRRWSGRAMYSSWYG